MEKYKDIISSIPKVMTAGMVLMDTSSGFLETSKIIQNSKIIENSEKIDMKIMENDQKL